MGSLDTLVSFLASRVDDHGAWSATSDEVRAALGADAVAWWRALHQARDRVAWSDAVDGFTQDTVGDLVTVLETLAGPAAERALADAGLFIPHERGVELMADLVDAAVRFAAGHRVNADDLEAMLRHARGVRAAVDIYLGEHFDRDALVDACVEAWCARAGMPGVAAPTAARYLRQLFTRHVMDARALVAPLVTRLRDAAAGMGWVDPDESARGGPRRARDARDGRRAGGRDDRARAASVMGLDPSARLDPALLRQQYRRLVMRFHPDVDPSALERCKDINAAYALLSAAAAAGA